MSGGLIPVEKRRPSLREDAFSHVLPYAGAASTLFLLRVPQKCAFFFFTLDTVVTQ